MNNVVDLVLKFFGDPSSTRTIGFERLALASVVPILTSALWYNARTVVDVSDPEQGHWIQLWLSHQRQSLQLVRRFSLLSWSGAVKRRNLRQDHDGGGQEKDNDWVGTPALTLLPANGISVWVWFGRWPVSISSVQLNGNDVLDLFRSRNGHVGYSITIWFAPCGTALAKELILQGRKLWLAKRSEKTEIWVHKPHHHPTDYDISTRKSRPLSSVIVETGIKEALVADATEFLEGEQWYVKKGIPYRRGYLLYGPPGCGKTSLVTALAGHLRVPIVLVSLGSKAIDDGTLASALSRAPRHSIVLIEDVDCAFIPQEGIDLQQELMARHHYVTLSGLLNAIDGVAAQDGRILVMTTNHKDRLSEALIRPGRVDIQYELGFATKDGARNLFSQFFPPSEHINEDNNLEQARDDFVAQIEDGVHSFAKLQGILMQNRDAPSAAAEAMRKSNSLF